MKKNENFISHEKRFILKADDYQSSVIEFFLIMSVFTLIHFLHGLTKTILFNSILKSQRKNFW